MEKGIKASWSLVAFARTHGKMKVGAFVNKDTGEAFKSCMFVGADNNVTAVVNFSSNLGELTPQQIASMKDDLQVVQLNSGTYKLCKNGSTWEEVDLGL
jgi:hypothetical protein